MLVDENGISIGIGESEEGWAAAGLVRSDNWIESSALEFSLEITDVLEIGQRLFIAIPSRL